MPRKKKEAPKSVLTAEQEEASNKVIAMAKNGVFTKAAVLCFSSLILPNYALESGMFPIYLQKKHAVEDISKQSSEAILLMAKHTEECTEANEAELTKALAMLAYTAIKTIYTISYMWAAKKVTH